jgi:adhesin/invasin
VSLSAASVVSGSAATVTLQAEDAAGNKLNSGGLAVAFAPGSASGGQGTFGTVTDNHNGTYTAIFTGTAAGGNTIAATIGGQAVTSTAPSITVMVGQVSLSKSLVSLSSASVASGSSVTVTLQAEDAAGNKLTAGGLTVLFALAGTSGGHGTFSSVTDNKNGTYTARFTGTTAGVNSITATMGGKAVTSTTPTLTVVVGPLSLARSFVMLSSTNVIVSHGVTVTLQAEDAAGNKLTTGGLSVAFAIGNASGGQGIFISTVADNEDGTYTATFAAITAGTNTIKARIGGVPVTSTAPTISVAKS